MSNTNARPMIDEAVLQRARQTLEARIGDLDDGHPDRASIDEALRWIDSGVYGGCSICGHALPTAQILAAPADMVCSTCRHVARICRHGALASGPSEGPTVADLTTANGRPS
jgi:RNA polymerase-binding transcription factor DksA